MSVKGYKEYIIFRDKGNQKKLLKILANKQERSVSNLLQEAVKDLLEKYLVPSIGKEL